MLLLAAVAGWGCEPEDPGEPACPSCAAFAFTLAAEAGPVPRQTTLTVTYGGGVEQYALASPPVHSDVLFCSSEPRDDAEGGVARVFCDVWTQSTTSLKVESDGYPTFERELTIDRDEHECLRTREVALLLALPAEGG
jgi:hypothetical protein